MSSDNGVLVSDSDTDSVQVLPGAKGMPVDDASVLTIDKMSTNAVATTAIVKVYHLLLLMYQVPIHWVPSLIEVVTWA